MDETNTVKSVFVELQLLEKLLAQLDQDYARAEAERRSRPGAAAENPEGARIEAIRRLVGRLKEDATAESCEAVLKDKQFADLKKEAAEAKTYLAALVDSLKEKTPAPLTPAPAAPAAQAGLRADLPLTAAEDRAHNALEGERREFKEHYDALELEFETREKQLLDELRALKESDLRREMENEKLKTDLALAVEKRQAAEAKASSLSVQLMEINVYNKSAALALKDKDLEIADLKQALAAAKAGK